LEEEDFPMESAAEGMTCARFSSYEKQVYGFDAVWELTEKSSEENCSAKVYLVAERPVEGQGEVRAKVQSSEESRLAKVPLVAEKPEVGQGEVRARVKGSEENRLAKL